MSIQESPSSTCEEGRKLHAISINGAIHVESADDAKRRAEKRRLRASRWDSAAAGQGPDVAKKEKNESKDQQRLPASIDTSIMDEQAQKMYILKLQIQEATASLAKPDLGIPSDPRQRSPSPEPVYNGQGVRINTRTERTRTRLILQRNTAISQLKELDPSYQPPGSFMFKNVKLEDKVLLPANECPHINFMGLLLGPRGNYLEELKKELNVNIVIRGKGSLRSGMTGITKDGRKFEGLDEPLHAFISGHSAEDVQKATSKIQQLVDMQIYSPDCDQAVALRARHMHELAKLNGTLKDIDLKCLNCGLVGHKSWQCTEKANVTTSVLCTACGGAGHITSDCRQKRPGAHFSKAKPLSCSDSSSIDKEYEAFLNESNLDEVQATSFSSSLSNSSRCFSSVSARPMLCYDTHGKAEAASSNVRAPNRVKSRAEDGRLKSIFGGKLTRPVSSFRSQTELETEMRKQKEQHQQRLVPVEWQVERYEQSLSQRHHHYLSRLEQFCHQERQSNLSSTSLINAAKCPPPPLAQRSDGHSEDGLPDIISPYFHHH